MNVWDKLAAKEYETKLTHPQLPREPSDRHTYIEARRAYLADVERLEALFKHDLAEYHGVVGNPKLERLTQIVWNERRNHDADEIASFFSDLVELIK